MNPNEYEVRDIYSLPTNVQEAYPVLERAPLMARYRIYLCGGGDYTSLQERGECPNALHDWPLPQGYVDASEVAMARLRARWSNRKCRQCGLYGWAPGQRTEGSHAVEVKP